MQDVVAAIHLLPLRIHAIEKSAGVPLQNVAYAPGLDDVDADLGAHERSPQIAARRVARGAMRLRDARVPRTRFAIARRSRTGKGCASGGASAPRDRTRRASRAPKVIRQSRLWPGCEADRHHCLSDQ